MSNKEDDNFLNEQFSAIDKDISMKEAIIDLYLNVKIRNSEDVYLIE
jgi:hypothetical protein